MDPAERKQRFFRVGVAFAAAAALISFYLAAVHVSGMMPRCVFRWVTGWSCPGCGSQRAFMELLHGHVCDAVRMNFLLPFGIFYLMILLAGYLFAGNRTVDRICGRATSPAALTVLVAVILAWTVARNIMGV